MHIFQRIGRSPVFVRGVQPFSSLSLAEWRRCRDFLQILKVPVCKVPVCEFLIQSWKRSCQNFAEKICFWSAVVENKHQRFPERSWRSFRRNWRRTSGEVWKEIFELLLLGKIVRNIFPPKLHRKFHHQTSLRGSGLWRALQKKTLTDAKRLVEHRLWRCLTMAERPR